MRIRPATPDDYPAIDDLVIEAFGQVDEARLCDMLRRDRAVALELVAQEGDALLGHILFSRFTAPAGWLALAPVSVRPGRQGKGIGGALIREGLAQAAAEGWTAAVVLGNPRLYGRFGFSVAQAGNLTSPYPLEYTGLRWLGEPGGAPALELKYPDAFARLEG